jgi:tRNA(fMet)-specific endonuclease VapC
MEAATEPVACTIVSVEEALRGWLAVIHKWRDVRRQVPPYARLGQLFDVLSDWEILAFDDRAADRFEDLRRRRICIGTMDLKIATIALVHDARFLTANLRDFSVVPDLRCEDWLRPKQTP